ncbi:MAG: hypothetical protein CM1200mP20_07070 [Pseudomonadota bacterium]|nr:MAG: hypothetical protein CM1200mP20_07070 [Pseudomonadota bacterium]
MSRPVALWVIPLQRFATIQTFESQIFTGAGERFFCPGWDLKAAAEGEAVGSDYGVGGFGGLQELQTRTSRSLQRSTGSAAEVGWNWRCRQILS